MALNFPYSYISCPCSDVSRRITSSKRTSREIDIDEALDQDDSTFNASDPRSAFSLFPPEHLFYCEDCRDLKCPRCVVEEIVCTYCPHCLFESVPSQVKSERNRCPRNCYICPICQSQLQTSSLTGAQATTKPYILSCNYCMWSSLDSGISFASPTNIRQQMEGKDRDGRDHRSSVTRPKLNSLDQSYDARVSSSGLAHEYVSTSHQTKLSDNDETQSPKTLDHNSRFNALKSFYKGQLAAIDASQSASSLDAFSSSPASLTRLMSLYGTGAGSGSTSVLNRKAKSKPSTMREALTSSEGLQLTPTQPDSPPKESFDYLNVPTTSQLLAQYPSPLGNPTATHTSALKPMPTPLRTKRSKRCATCKHILVKPELKVTSTRYRIKLIAQNYIPHVTLKPLPNPNNPIYTITTIGIDGSPSIKLPPNKPSQWILTLRNPLFENVNVSLGSPAVTPGKYGHKVTILCPEFSIGKNGDVWDDASLVTTTSTASSGLSISGGMPRSETTTGLANEQVAGKVFEKGRNWTSVVVEIVPCSIVTMNGEVVGQDEDVIEVPVRVRLEWKVTDEQALRDVSGSARKNSDLAKEGDDDGSRELAYWMVLGIGRVG